MLRLSRLSPVRAVNVRFAAPGHANPHFLDRARFIDRNHPAARLALRSLPAFVCPQFTIRAFPNAILHEPADFVPVNPILATSLVRARTRQSNSDITPRGKEANFDAIKRAKFSTKRRLADAYLAALARRGRHNVGLLFHASKKATSKSSVVRRRLRSKMKAAIGLVISRNADAMPAPSSDQPQKSTLYPPLHLVTRPLQENESFVLKGWTYLVIPDLVIYKMPLPNLVQVVREALLSLSQRMKRCETLWCAQPKHKPLPPRLPFSSNIVNNSQPAVRTRTRGPPRHPPEPEGPDKPSKDQSMIVRLYSHRPIILSHEKPKPKK